MKIIRLILGRLILLFDSLFPPRAEIKRGAGEQERVEKQARSLALYQFEACPFCVKVRRAAKRMNIPLSTRDVLKNKNDEAELLNGGGTLQVPCLRVEEAPGKWRWLYESDDIINYLKVNFP